MSDEEFAASEQRSEPEKPVPKLKLYSIISDAVSKGVAYGYRRAFKYSEDPSPEHIIETIESAVMNELSEVISYGDD